MDEKKVKELRALYKPGTRIKLIHMDDEQGCRLDGSLGTVGKVDDAGTIHMYWDMGSSLGLLPEVDTFEIIEE